MKEVDLKKKKKIRMASDLDNVDLFHETKQY